MKNAVSSGTQSTAAQKRGATVFATGSIAIRPSAVIWSVARIRPSSAAIEDPARPTNSKAVSTGPSSRYRPRPSRALTWPVAPRFWAAVLCVPLLTAFFISLAIAAGYFEAVHVIGIDGGTFWQTMKDSVDFRDDYLIAFFKAAVFGAISALVASYVGYHAEPTIEGTSVATTRAVVNASLLVLMFNFVLSALLFRS